MPNDRDEVPNQRSLFEEATWVNDKLDSDDDFAPDDFAPDDFVDHTHHDGVEATDAASTAPRAFPDANSSPAVGRASQATQVGGADRSAAAILTALRASGVHGHDEVVRYLSLLGDWRYRSSGARTRLLLVGPPSSGKTFLLRSFSEAVGLPYVQCDASSISDHGWSGQTVADVVHAAYVASGKDAARLERDGCVLVLDEIDKACVRRRDAAGEVDGYGNAVRISRQGALLQLLWGDTPVQFSTEGASGGMNCSVRTNRFIVVAAGAFSGSEFATGRGPIGDHDLTQWGCTPELASRLTTRLRLEPRSLPEIARLLRKTDDGVSFSERAVAAFGYRLVVTDEAIALVARAVAAEQFDMSVRVGAGILVEAANRTLLRAIDDRLPPGSRLVVTPDDVVGQVARPRRTPDRAGPA